MNALRSRSLLLAFVGALCLVSSAAALADEVVLMSGERLVGRIVKLGEELVIETNHSGTVRVNMNDVVEITTDAPLDVMLA